MQSVIVLTQRVTAYDMDWQCTAVNSFEINKLLFTMSMLFWTESTTKQEERLSRKQIITQNKNGEL